jgi:predicted ATPase
MNLSVREFKAQEFRSLKNISYPMSSLDVFVGANGVGKTNLYRSLELLQSAAANTLARDLASEGGLESAMWAGRRRRGEPACIRLAVGLADPVGRHPSDSLYRYEVEIGFPQPLSATLGSEPQIKAETLTYTGAGRSSRLMTETVLWLWHAARTAGQPGSPWTC